MGFPCDGVSRLYRNPMAQVVRFLEARHGGRYKVYNLCVERGYDAAAFGGRVVRLPMYDGQAPPLSLLLALCRDAARWLAADAANVVAVHCKAGKGRTGAAVCALLLAMEPQLSAASLPAVLAYWARQRTKDGKGLTIASQRRFVEYFHALLLVSNGHLAPCAVHTTLQPGCHGGADKHVPANHDGSIAPPAGHPPTTTAAAAGAGLAVLERVHVPVGAVRLCGLRLRGLPAALLRNCTVSVWNRPTGHYAAHPVCHLHTRPDGGHACFSGSTTAAATWHAGFGGATLNICTYQSDLGLEEGELSVDFSCFSPPPPPPPPEPLPYYKPPPPSAPVPSHGDGGSPAAAVASSPGPAPASLPVSTAEADRGASVNGISREDGKGGQGGAAVGGPVLCGDIKIQLFRGCVPEPDADVFKGRATQFSAWLAAAFLDPGAGELLLGRSGLDKLSKPLRRWRGGLGLVVEYEAVAVASAAML